MKIEWNNDPEKWFEWAAGRYVTRRLLDPIDHPSEITDWVRSRHKIWMDEEFQSPIERALFAFALFGIDGYLPIQYRRDPEKNWGTRLDRQIQIGRFRVDFQYTVFGSHGRKRLVVECDGHDFHERTREQAAHDKARDRAIVNEGCRVIRFTGSEIFRDPVKVITEVEGHLFQLMDEVMFGPGGLAKATAGFSQWPE